MSQNICTLVDLFDNAVAEGARPNNVKTRSEPYDETEIWPDTQAVQSALSDLKGPPEPLQSQCNYRLFIT